MFENIIKKQLVSKFNKKWKGKKVKLCPKIYSEALTTRLDEVFCSESLSSSYNFAIYNNKEPKFKLSKYIKDLNSWLEKNADNQGPCSNCILAKEEEPHLEDNAVKKFILNHYTQCPLNCIYCRILDKNYIAETKVKKYIMGIEKIGLIDKNCIFEWNGGEPYLCDEFPSLYDYIHKRGYSQVIYTSGVRYLPLFSEILKNGDSIIISPDCGHKKTFEGIKRSNCYDLVWDNIEYIAGLGGDFTVKYIIFALNSRPAEIEEFIKKCVERNVKKVLIDCEISSMSGMHPSPITITDKEVDAAILLKKLCKENNIEYTISSNWTKELFDKISST